MRCFFLPLQRVTRFKLFVTRFVYSLVTIWSHCPIDRGNASKRTSEWPPLNQSIQNSHPAIRQEKRKKYVLHNLEICKSPGPNLYPLSALDTSNSAEVKCNMQDYEVFTRCSCWILIFFSFSENHNFIETFSEGENTSFSLSPKCFIVIVENLLSKITELKHQT